MFTFGSKNKLTQKLKASWGTIKEEDFNFNWINLYHKKKDNSQAYQIISERTISDIDFYEIFYFVDRTISKVGQQYLFNKLLTINQKIDFNEQEEIIDFYLKDEHSRIKSQMLLSKLNSHEAYNISSLFLDSFLKPSKYFFLIKILSFISVLSFLSIFFNLKLVILFIPIVCINIYIHYNNKKNIDYYSNSIKQLLLLCKCTKELLKIPIPIIDIDLVKSSLKSVQSLHSRLLIFQTYGQNSSEILELILLIFEYIKIIFLLEPVILFSTLQKLSSKKEDIQVIFENAGKIDSNISIISFRQSLKYHCKPIIIDTNKELTFEEIFHPLVSNCVPNSMMVKGRSILLTGSNMSGKTTFIRTVAINTIFAQTINTCLAKSFSTPKIKIYSVIRIADSLINDKSYFFEEVLVIKDIIKESEESYNKLFLLDEIYKGTNTIERIAIAKSVLSFICKNNNIVFVSTHDVELTEMLTDSYDLYHFTEIVESNQISFDYKLKSGFLKTRNAIRILEINDYPQQITNNATQIAIELSS